MNSINERAIYEVKEAYIYKTDFSSDFMGGYRTLKVGVNTALGREWVKDMESDNLASFLACHPAD